MAQNGTCPAGYRREPLSAEEQKRTEIALFRYRLIAPLLDHPLIRGEIVGHLQAVAAQRYQIPYSKRTTINADIHGLMKDLFDLAGVSPAA